MPLYIRSPILILGKSSVSASGGADTNENILGTVTIPAGIMGTSGQLIINSTWTYSNSASAKTLRIRFGGIGGTIYLTTAPTTTLTYRDFRTIANNNAANAQVSGTSAVASTGFQLDNAANITSSVDTTAETTLVFTGQKASAGDTLTLQQYSVQLLLP